jgi:hypothetical protein
VTPKKGEPAQLWIVHAYNLIHALDRDRSVFTRSPRGDVSMIEKLVLDTEAQFVPSTTWNDSSAFA